jgi:hypothetical protein
VQVTAASLPPSPIEENLSESQPHRALVFDDSPGKSDPSLKLHDSSSGSNVVNSSSSAEDDSSEKGDAEELGEEMGGGFCTEEEYFTEEEGAWEEEGSDEGCFDDLSDEMSKMTVFDEEEEKAGLPQFEGKHHLRFQDDEDEGD